MNFEIFVRSQLLNCVSSKEIAHNALSRFIKNADNFRIQVPKQAGEFAKIADNNIFYADHLSHNKRYWIKFAKTNREKIAMKMQYFGFLVCEKLLNAPVHSFIMKMKNNDQEIYALITRDAYQKTLNNTNHVRVFNKKEMLEVLSVFGMDRDIDQKEDSIYFPGNYAVIQYKDNQKVFVPFDCMISRNKCRDISNFSKWSRKKLNSLNINEVERMLGESGFGPKSDIYQDVISNFKAIKNQLSR